MWIDSVIAFSVIAAIILLIWSKLTKKTITELINELVDFIKERKESMKETTIN